MSQYSYKLAKSEVEELRKNYGRSIEFSFVLKSQPFLCFTDLQKDGGLAPSTSFYKSEEGKPGQFLFWTSRPIDSPQTAEYVFTEFFQKDGLTADSPSGQALTPNNVQKPKRRYVYQLASKSLINEKFMSKTPEGGMRGILRLENDRECLDTWNVDFHNGSGLHHEDTQSLTVSPLGVSKLMWLQAQGSFVKGEYEHTYEILDKGFYTVESEDENGSTLSFEGEKLTGRYHLNTTSLQITKLGENHG